MNKLQYIHINQNTLTQLVSPNEHNPMNEELVMLEDVLLQEEQEDEDGNDEMEINEDI